MAFGTLRLAQLQTRLTVRDGLSVANSQVCGQNNVKNYSRACDFTESVPPEVLLTAGQKVHAEHCTRFGESRPPAGRSVTRRSVCDTAHHSAPASGTKESRPYAAWLGARRWRTSGQPGMRAVAVVIALEIEELELQIGSRPEQCAVQAFAPNGADQPFNKWMRKRRVRNGLDFLYVQDPKIPLPSAELVQGSWSELRRAGGVLPRVARLNMQHSPTPSTTP